MVTSEVKVRCSAGAFIGRKVFNYIYLCFIATLLVTHLPPFSCRTSVNRLLPSLEVVFVGNVRHVNHKQGSAFEVLQRGAVISTSLAPVSLNIFETLPGVNSWIPALCLHRFGEFVYLLFRCLLFRVMKITGKYNDVLYALYQRITTELDYREMVKYEFSVLCKSAWLFVSLWRSLLLTMCGSAGSGSRQTGYRLGATCLGFILQTHRNTNCYTGGFLVCCCLSRRLKLWAGSDSLRLWSLPWMPHHCLGVAILCWCVFMESMW